MAATDEVRSGEVDRIKDDLQRLRDDLGKLLGHVGSYSKEKFGGTKEKVSTTMEDLQGRAYDRVQEAARGVSDRGWRAAATSRDKVQERPLTWIGVAFVAGLAFATLFMWKR